ncbi:MAG TPA: hypothetical protein VNA17_01185 [Pyrinomonadaceae bacterium]|nr:hypothetical protein [Pyrinomonadaceae bacterium]
MRYVFPITLFIAVCLSTAAEPRAQANCVGPQIFTASACAGDAISDEEMILFDLVNSYRKARNLPTLKSSASLSRVANRRMLDLKQNLKRLTHSWSDCSYDLKDSKTWHCVENAPKRLSSGYAGQGYETLYRAVKGKAVGPTALAEWQKSQLHNSIILNEGIFKSTPWDEMGVAIDGEYASLWFGFPGRPATGAGILYASAVKGLADAFTLSQINGKESAATADSNVMLSLAGPNKEVSEISLKLQPGGRLLPDTVLIASAVLKNLFNEWTDSDGWIARGAAAIDENPTAVRTKFVREMAVELRSGGPDLLNITIKPRTLK